MFVTQQTKSYISDGLQKNKKTPNSLQILYYETTDFEMCKIIFWLGYIKINYTYYFAIIRVYI